MTHTTPNNEAMVNSPHWQSKRFRSTEREELMDRKQKYFRRRGKRGVIYLSERYMGIQLWDSLDTTDERIAEIRRREKHIQIEKGDYQKSRTTFNEAVVESLPGLLKGKAARTRSGYQASFKNHIVPWFGQAGILDLTDADLIEYKGSRESTGAGQKTIIMELWLLRWVLERYKITLEPLKQAYIKPEKVYDRFLTMDELMAIVRCLSGESVAVVLVAAFSGLRKGDLLNLKWSQVDFRAGFIKVSQEKTNHTVKIPIHVRLKDALDLVPKGIGDSAVFRIKKTPLFYRWNKARIMAGLAWARFHDLRHFFASYLASQGVRREVIAELMGHKDMRSTARYARFDDQALKDATAVFCCQTVAKENKSDCK